RLSKCAHNFGTAWIECAFVTDLELLHLKAKHVVLQRNGVHFEICGALIGTIHHSLKLAVWPIGDLQNQPELHVTNLQDTVPVSRDTRSLSESAEKKTKD